MTSQARQPLHLSTSILIVLMIFFFFDFSVFTAHFLRSRPRAAGAASSSVRIPLSTKSSST